MFDKLTLEQKTKLANAVNQTLYNTLRPAINKLIQRENKPFEELAIKNITERPSVSIMDSRTNFTLQMLVDLEERVRLLEEIVRGE